MKKIFSIREQGFYLTICAMELPTNNDKFIASIYYGQEPINYPIWSEVNTDYENLYQLAIITFQDYIHSEFTPDNHEQSYYMDFD